MTGRERLLWALNQQPVDRMPVSPFIHANFVREFFGALAEKAVRASSAIPGDLASTLEFAGAEA